MKAVIALATIGLSLNALALSSTYFDSLDVNALHTEEVFNERKGEAPRFAVPQKVSINAVNSQNWERTADGYVWSHQVTTPNAVSLNFGFTQFHLPEGAKLDIYSADRSEFIRTFTAADNNVNNQLWTPVIMSDDVMIELFVPEAGMKDLALELTQVGQGFRTFTETTLKSGSCNIDVACTDSRGWEKEVNSVGVISTGGSSFCTGFMVNNAKKDKAPFFMTANHCRINASNASSLVVYWNYQSSKCGGDRDGKLTEFQTGSTFLSAGAKTDFTLVKLNSQPKPEWHVNYAGWDVSGKDAVNTTVIHHPNTDEKAISFDKDASKISSYGGEVVPGDSTHVWVVDYEKGTTEPGSSGSPLFNEKHQVIGQLHGGGAACGNDLPDWYGRLSVSWVGDGTLNGSLKGHLDPDKTGITSVDTL